MSSIQPLADRLVAEPQKASAKTSAGILLPTDSRQKQQIAKVIMVGPDVKAIKKDDSILFDDDSFKTSLVKVKFEGNEVIILREKDVLGVVK